MGGWVVVGWCYLSCNMIFIRTITSHKDIHLCIVTTLYFTAVL